MPTYTDKQILDRNKSGKDKERADKNSALFAQATQPPHNDDAAALQQLQVRAGDDSTGGLATNDGRNHARMLLNSLGGPQMGYSEARDGGGFLGSLGDVLKFAAPVAGMAIPGLGPIAAGAIAAGGSAAGGMLSGDKFDLGKTLLAGAGGAGGNLLLGGQGFGGIKGIPSRLGIGGGAGGASAGNTTAGGLVGQTSGGGGGILGKVGGFLGGSDGFGMDDVLKVGGTISAIEAQRSADKQRSGAVEGATNEWNARAPLRAQSMAGIQNLGNVQRPDLSHVFADPSNPYYRAPKPLTQRYG